jgi:hypothetical protein
MRKEVLMNSPVTLQVFENNFLKSKFFLFVIIIFQIEKLWVVFILFLAVFSLAQAFDYFYFYLLFMEEVVDP